MTEPLLKPLAPGERRYVVKPRVTGRTTRYEVYDRATGSIPLIRRNVGVVQQDHKTEESAQTEADRLENEENNG